MQGEGSPSLTRQNVRVCLSRRPCSSKHKHKREISSSLDRQNNRESDRKRETQGERRTGEQSTAQRVGSNGGGERIYIHTYIIRGRECCGGGGCPSSHLHPLRAAVSQLFPLESYYYHILSILSALSDLRSRVSLAFFAQLYFTYRPF